MRRIEILERVIELMAQDAEVGLAAMYEMMFAPTKTYPLGYLAEDGSAHLLHGGTKCDESST